MAGFSFRHHGIKDGDELYVIRPNSGGSPGNQRSPRANEVVRGANSFLQEAARLSDLSYHGRVIRERSEETETSRAHPWETILEGAGRAGAPSTQPLPSWWE
jgi:hypothetical protein